MFTTRSVSFYLRTTEIRVGAQTCQLSDRGEGTGTTVGVHAWMLVELHTRHLYQNDLSYNFLIPNLFAKDIRNQTYE